MGDPITVGQQSRPVDSSIDKWVAELLGDESKLALARDIASALNPEDLALWGHPKDSLFDPLEAAAAAGDQLQFKKPKLNNYVLQRRVMLALKKNIHERPHGRFLRRLRYYCNVLLREG